MKIGLICPYNLYKGGGVQECVLAQHKELAKRGHKVCIVTPFHRSFPDKYPSHIKILGKAASIKSFHTTAQISISVSPYEVEALLKKEDFDLLHFHEPWVPLMAKQILANSTSKHVATFHAKLPDSSVSATIQKVTVPYTKPIMRRMDALTAVSEVAAEFARQITDKKIEIIPNGIGVKKFSVKHEQTAPNVLFIGRLEKRKGVKYLLRAFEILQEKHPKVKLVLAGDGSFRNRLEDEAAHLDLKNTEFLGYVDEAQKLKLLSQATVFCSPAIHGESFGIVLLESMAAGVPIVAADNAGYQTVMVDEGMLSLVNVKDSKEFARRLELLLFNQELRQHWQNWAKKYIQQFDYKNVIDRYEALYNKVLGS